MDLCGCLDEVLQVGASEEVAEVHEFAVAFVLDIHDTPAIGTTSDLTAIDCDVLLRSYNSEWDDALSVH